MADIKQSASASATGQVGVINVEGGFSFSPSLELKTPGFIEGLLAPRRARRSAEAARKINDSIAGSMAAYMSLSPTVSPERAYLMAMTGLMFTERQTENLLAVLGSAAESAGGEADPSRISNMARDKILTGACEADDDVVRSMWKRLVLGEMDSPGRYSRRTMSLLSDMDSDDAELFRRVCSFCSGGMDENGVTQPTIPFLYLDSPGTSYCDGEISYSDMSRLVALGLVTSNSFKSFGDYAIFCIGGKSYMAQSAESSELRLSSVTLTDYGEEISELASDAIGTNPRLLDIAKKHVELQGYVIAPFAKAFDD